MKTTVEIPDELSHRAREFAQRRGLTLRELIERGLRSQLREPEAADEWRWTPLVKGKKGDPMPSRPPHEYAYDDSL